VNGRPGTPRVEAIIGDVRGLRALLSKHPHVSLKSGTTEAAIEFWQDDWHRTIWIDNPSVSLSGLVELVDNNPLVCADAFSVPSAEATMALIAFGPLIRSGILVEAPAGMLSFESSSSSIDRALSSMGWRDGAAIAAVPQDLGTVVAGRFTAIVQTPSELDDLDDAYNGIYGSSFFVRRNDSSDWDPSFVEGKAFALYGLSIAPETPHSLLTIRVLADRNGKCGAAQVVHALNVMCGWEESVALF